MNLAPIVLFVYNRPWHTQQIVKALQNNDLADGSKLYIFSDAAKNDAEVENVEKVREYIKTINGFKQIIIVEREKNYGLANSIISGVTGIVNSYGKIIVLEDDLVTSKHFLSFMNGALEFYKDENKVISIHGYIYPIKSDLPETFFIKGADCWGWATWKRGWDIFEPNGKKLLDELKDKNLEKKFDINGSYAYTKMLSGQVARSNDSWAIRWYASAFLKDKLTLYPGRSLVSNIGCDESGTHCGNTNILDTTVSNRPVKLRNIPIEENTFVLREFEKYFRAIGNNLTTRIFNRIIRRLLKINRLKQIVKKITPQIFLDIFIYRRGITKYGFFGNFSTWKDAVKVSTGYSSNEIIKKVKESLLKVKAGEAIYERDSFLFDKIHYSWPLLAGLLWIASQRGNRLNLIDFGGSLGSSYFQNRKFLMHLKELKWNIIEQEKMVECGKKYFETDCLKFYFNIDDCIEEQNPDLILLSSVIQYIEKPYDLLNKIINYGLEFIIFDRTAFIKGNNDRLTVQKVPPIIYKASYPAWFFSEIKFLKYFEEKYELVEEFEALGKDSANIPSEDKGFIFRRKKC